MRLLRLLLMPLVLWLMRLLVLLVAALVDGAAVGALGVRIIAKKSRAKLGGVVGLSLLNFIGDQNNLIKIDYRSYI